MKRFVLVLFVVGMTVCSCTKAGVLPQKKMTSIYIDMYLLDRYIEGMPDFKPIADTTFVYEPVLKKHHCSEEKFIRSVQYYLTKPKKYEKILKNVKKYFEEMEQKAVEMRDIPTPMEESEMEEDENDAVEKAPAKKRRKTRENNQ